MILDEEADVLCIYGSGQQNVAAKWLAQKEKRRVVIFEQNPSFSSMPENIRSVCLPCDEEEYKRIAWDFLFLQFTYLPLSCYAEEERVLAEKIFQKMAHVQEGVFLLASDYKDFGKQITANFLNNLSLLPLSRPSSHLCCVFKGVPALICGAGPSLEKDLNQIKELSQNALIFAGGSALAVLSQSGIAPHLGASLDPNPPYRRFLEQTAFEVPFLYQSRVCSRLLGLVHAPLLWTEGSGGYPLEEALLKQLGIEQEPFEGGWNVAAFCIALALRMGCNPIIFTGMDLAAKEKKLYARGVLEDKTSRLIESQDIRGHPIYTQRDWVMAAKDLEELFAARPDTLFINATHGGRGFKGTLELPLSEIKDRHLQKKWDLAGMLHAAVEATPLLPVDFPQVETVLFEVKSSAKRCREFCSKLLQEIEKSYPKIPWNKGEYALLAFELEEELVYQTLLLPIWEIWKTPLLREAGQPLEGAQKINQLLFFRKILDETAL